MKLSIIIAAYNVEKYIEKCIYSCVQQEYDNNFYEIIVVNDGSTDKTLEILNKLKGEIDNLKIFHQKNAGLGASRNKGLKECRGEYVWFIDGDDYIKENILKEIIFEINKNDLDTLVLNYSVVDAEYNITSSNLNNLFGTNDIITGSVFYKNNYSKSYSWLFVFKRSLFDNGEINFKERINMQDSEILPKLMINTHRLSFLKTSSYYYVQHDDSFTNSSNGDKRFAYFESIIEVRESLLAILKANENEDLRFGINRKLDSLHEVVFNHLVFFQYENDWFKKTIEMLKLNGYYPLRNNPKGKMKLIKFGLNLNPVFVKKMIDLIRK